MGNDGNAVHGHIDASNQLSKIRRNTKTFMKTNIIAAVAVVILHTSYEAKSAIL